MEPNPKDITAEALPPIPAKRYFTIGEVSELCGVKPHVLRYWEQEFPTEAGQAPWQPSLLPAPRVAARAEDPRLLYSQGSPSAVRVTGWMMVARQEDNGRDILLLMRKSRNRCVQNFCA